MRSLQISKLFLLIGAFTPSFFSIQTYAQNPLPSSASLVPPPLEGEGILRVGSAPLPLPRGVPESKSFSNSYERTPQETASTVFKTLSPSKQENITTHKVPSTYFPGSTQSRTVYLNGVNISSIRNEELEDVKVRIDNRGNIFIEAPGYEVSTGQSFHPLLPEELPEYRKQDKRGAFLPEKVFSKNSEN